MEKKLLIIIALNSVIAVSILLINLIYLRELAVIFSLINFVGMFIFAGPIVIIKYRDYSKLKEMEEMFPVFLRDFVESVRGGMTIPQAFKSVSGNEYKGLNKYVKKISAQLDWGIPVDKVLLKFSDEAKSKIIARIVSSVVESHRFGGSLTDTLEALSNTAIEVERLRTERKLYMHSQMITGYIIFFVFLGVMVGLEKFLVPGLAEAGSGMLGVGGAGAMPGIAEEYKTVFRDLILIQGLFAGLSVGKMSEGAIISGIKHSLFMMFVGFLVFTLVA